MAETKHYVTFTLTVDVDDNWKNSVREKLPSLDELIVMAGVQRVSMTTTVVER